MKYGEIRKELSNSGFDLICSETEGVLDMLIYEHPDMNGVIGICFSDENDIPSFITKGETFSYNDDWVEEMVVSLVDFDIDCHISYNGIDRNRIVLIDDNLKYFKYVLSLVCDPCSSINFHFEFNERYSNFLNGVKRFIPSIEKYDLKCRVFRINEYKDTLYSNMCVVFGRGEYMGVYFYFDLFTWEQYIIIDIDYLNNKKLFEFDCNILEFERELEFQYDKYR